MLPPEMHDIHQSERFYAHAWNAFENIHHEGWWLRFADGYTRRANSVLPLDSPSITLDAQLKFCQHAFQTRGLPLVVKMTPAAQPSDLDAQLAQRGFTKSEHVRVMEADIRGLIGDYDSRLQRSDRLTDIWLDDYCRLNVVDSRKLPPMRRLLGRLTLQTCFVRLLEEDSIRAVGLGVSDGERVALFDIVTHIQHRRRGLGSALVRGLMLWGRIQGARTATLQVLATNTAAIALYDRLGFRYHHDYWYRTAPDMFEI